MIKIKRNDTGTPVQDTLNDSSGAINLTGATVRFLMWRSGALKVDGSATIVDAANGVVKYDFTAGDVDEAGTFSYEWEITTAGAKVITVPNDGYEAITILADLG